MQKIYNSFRSNPHINKILESEQFPYSEKIMELRIKINIDIHELAAYLQLTPEQYIEYEYCNTDIPISEYEQIIQQLTIISTLLRKKRGNDYYVN